MTTITVDTSALLKWAQAFEDVATELIPAVARALNAVGDGIVTEVVGQLVDSTGFDAHTVRQSIDVYQADASDPTWRMFIRGLTPKEAPNWDRPWTSERDNTFEQDKLYNIITRADCCDICAQIAEQGPYTTEDINRFAAQWANYVPPKPQIGERTNLLHPNCFCATVPFQSYRRLPVTFTRPGGIMPEQLLTIKQIGRAVADEIRVVMRARGLR